MLWLILGLITALLYTGIHFVSKRTLTKGADPYYTAHLQFILTMPLSIIGIIFFHEQFNASPQGWLGLVALGIVMLFGQFLYMKSLQVGRLSKTVPLLTLTPLFTLPIAYVTLGELPGLTGILGVCVIVFGTYVLNFEHFSKKDLLGPFKALVNQQGSRYMLYVSLIYGFGSVTNKYVIVHASVLFQLFCSSFIIVAFQGAYLYYRDRNQYWVNLQKIFSRFRKPIFGIAVLELVMVSAQFTSMSLTFTAYAIALKRTTAFFTVLVGYIWLNERKDFAASLAGAIALIIGVVLIVL